MSARLSFKPTRIYNCFIRNSVFILNTINHIWQKHLGYLPQSQILFIISFCALFYPKSIAANEFNASESNSEESILRKRLDNKIISKPLDLLQDTLRLTGESIDYIVRPIDMYWGGDREIESSDETILIIDTASHFQELVPFYQTFNFKVKIILPRTQQRLQLFAESLREDDLIQSQGSSFFTREERLIPNESALGLQYITKFIDLFELSYRSGVLLKLDRLDLFFRARLQTKFYLTKSWRYRFNYKYEIYNSRGANVATYQFFERSLSPKFDFQAQTSGYWNDKNYHINLNQEFRVLQKSKFPTRSYTYQTGISYLNSRDGENFVHQAHYYQAGLSEIIYSNWLYLNLTLGVNYSLVFNFEPNPFFVIGFKMYSVPS